jgi:hypothetical protein
MEIHVIHAAVMALLGLEIPDEDSARELVGRWRQAPQLSDEMWEDVLGRWRRARRFGVVVLGHLAWPGEEESEQDKETATSQS